MNEEESGTREESSFWLNSIVFLFFGGLGVGGLLKTVQMSIPSVKSLSSLN
jgi:hypothetical protein